MTTESVQGRFHQFGVGDRLRAAREIAGLSQDELSQLTGISRQTISNYELGLSKKPKPPYVAAIALATNFDRDWLEHGIEPPDGDGDDGARHPSKLGGRPTGQYGHLPPSRLLHLPNQSWLIAAQTPPTLATLTKASTDLAA